MINNEVKREQIETRGQSGNEMWFDQQEGRITASNFHTYHTKMESILKSRKRSKSTYTPLVFNILNKSDDISQLPQIKWGIEHEKDRCDQLTHFCLMWRPNMQMDEWVSTMWSVYKA